MAQTVIYTVIWQQVLKREHVSNPFWLVAVSVTNFSLANDSATQNNNITYKIDLKNQILHEFYNKSLLSGGGALNSHSFSAMRTNAKLNKKG